MSSLTRVVVIAVSSVAIGLPAALLVHSCERSRAEERIKADAIAFESGLQSGLELANATEHAKVCPQALNVTPPDLTCSAEFTAYRKTEAANRANAKAQGWEEGYATGRGDWTALPYDCRRMR